MTKTILFSVTMMIASAAAAQKPQKADTAKTLTLVIDSAHARQFLIIFNTGLTNLMNTAIPANEVQAMTIYGTDLLNHQAAVYQSWFKVDSVRKK